jgi:hypothetical protein
MRLERATPMRESNLPSAVSAHSRMVELVIGARIALALRFVAEHRLADLIASGLTSPDALAAKTGFRSAALRRVLRGLAGVGVFAESSSGEFSNTDMSAYLREGVASSLREMALVLNDDAVLDAWLRLPAVLESEAPMFTAASGMPFFEYIAADQQRSELMSRYMMGIYGAEGGKIAAGYPFDRFGSLLDVGGGQGHVLLEILRRHPALKGALLELPRTAEIAHQFLLAQGRGDCEVFPGDFFKSLPGGFDAYLAKSVLHDWDDEKCVQILRNCRDAMRRDARVLIAEIVVEPGKPVGHPHRLVDLEMMVCFGGKERTAHEFAHLLSSAGLRMEKVTPIDNSFFTVIEALRV